jgi:hypothetical protein
LQNCTASGKQGYIHCTEKQPKKKKIKKGESLVEKMRGASQLGHVALP